MEVFHLNVVTPEGEFFSDDITKLIVRGVEGDLAILKDIAPIITPLRIGRIKIVKGDESRIAAVVDGYISVDDNYTIVATKAAQWADEINLESAIEARERAEEALRRDKGIDVVQAEQALKHAMNLIEVSREHKENK